MIGAMEPSEQSWGGEPRGQNQAVGFTCNVLKTNMMGSVAMVTAASKTRYKGRHFFGAACLACFVATAFVSADAAAQTNNLRSDLPRMNTSVPVAQELNEKFNVVRDVGGSLQEKISIANKRLSEVAANDSSQMVDEINKTFEEFREEIQVIINQTGDNSDLRNALSRARERTIVFRNDLAAKPDDYPNRDQRLGQLDVALDEYHTLKEQLETRRGSARDALFELSQQQGMIVEQVKFDQIVKAQEALRDVVAGLTILADSITDLQPPSMDGGAVQN